MKFSLFSPSFDPIVNMTIQFLDQLKVKISDTTINDALQYHPDYPSLLSVSDVLHQWNVANLVVQVEHSKLAELPTPFIAHFKSSMGDQFRLITSVDENSVKYSHTKNKWEIVTEDNFQKEWSGIILLAEADNDNKEKNYDNILEKERIESLLPIIFISIGLIFSGLGMLMIFMQFEKIATLEFSWAFLLLLKYTGLLVSIFLLWAEIDQSNSIIKKVCGEGKKKSNCQTVLQSKGAHLFPGLSWSEAGFFYFMGGWLLIIIYSFTGHSAIFGILALLSLLCVPYIFFSLYYQWRVVRKWCTLCLTVLAVVLLELTTYGIAGFSNHFAYFNQVDFATIVEFAFAFTFPILIWEFLKPRLIQLKETESEIKPLKRLKYNPEVFHGLLKSRRKMPEVPNDLSNVLQSKMKDESKSDICLIQVCNPYCSACAEVQPHLEELLEKVENLNVRIVFTLSSNPHDPALLPVRHFLSFDPEDGQKIKEALHDWYLWGAKDYAAFAEEYPVNESDLMEPNKDGLNRWCNEAGITHTPTFFINGYRLPDGYYVNDLKYLLFQT